DELAILRGDSFAVERRAAEPLGNMRPLGHLHPLGKDVLARCAERERSAPTLAGAADRGAEVADPAARDLGHEYYGRRRRRELTRVQTPQCSRRRLPADALRIFELLPIAYRAVPIVALHLAVFLRDDDTAQAMQAACVSAQEADRIAEHPHAVVCGQCRPLGIADALIDVQCCRLARDRNLASFVRLDRPGVT